MLSWIICCSIFLLHHKVQGTIDVNLSELEYLVARLNPFECRRLIAALHYTTYELPKNVAEAERRVDEEIPCLQQLLHWNSAPSEGRGKSHEIIVHRLRQINRNDLAEWLGKTAFKQLGKDLERAMEQPFKELDIETTAAISLGTVQPPDMAAIEEDSWADVNTVLVAILLGLLGTLITLICMTILYRIKMYFREREDKNRKKDGVEYESRKLIGSRKHKSKYNARSDTQARNIRIDNTVETNVD